MIFAAARQAAFFARNAEIRSNIDVIFRDVTTNHGNGYNKTTGSFRAPLGGIYVFHLFFKTENKSYLNIAIQVNGKTVCLGQASNDWDMGVCSAAVHLEEGAIVNAKRTAGAGRLDEPSFSSGFSGFLLSVL